ncbi:hypothetical protein O6P37_19880 [Mycobacterium sp. CPCC 205372]|uniref:Uncharacterized protein n=1 Tax=Mycobacterium hippophais TaxID=3016340 RepID=A0ABT4PX90_9MYCO|nr:hypothetical protein [Mycobacterium hippophais]MCZ8381133.1 hypothetical protein [Mycobacterium hippophais]
MTWQLHTYGAGEMARPEVPEWLAGPVAFNADPRGQLRPDRTYLIRPEFVAASTPLQGDEIDSSQLRATMAAPADHGLVALPERTFRTA